MALRLEYLYEGGDKIMDDNTNPNVPGSNPSVGSDAGQGQMPGAGVPQQPEPAQPAVEQPQVPSEPTVPQQPVADVPGQTTPEPTVGA